MDSEQQYELTRHYGLASISVRVWKTALMLPSQQDRDPNQVDPRHVTIIGRGGYADVACIEISID